MKQILRTSLWRERDLRLTGSAQAVVFLCDELLVVALLLHAFAAGWGSPGTALLLATAALPLAVGSVLAGPLVDRVSSRLLAAAAASAQAAVCLATALALVLGAPSWTVVACLLLVQVAQAVAGPTWSALLPGLVPRHRLAEAVGAVQTLVMLLGTAAPVLAGAAVGAGGVPLALTVCAVGFAAVAVLAVRVRTIRGGSHADAEAAPRVLDGLRLVRGDAVLRSFVVGFVAFVLAVEVVGVVLVLLVRGDLGGSALDYGLVGTALAAGLVAGNVVASRLGTGRRLVRAAVVGAAGMSVWLVVGGLAPGVLVLAAAMLALGACNGVVNVSAQTTLALRVAPEQRGRVLGTVTGALRTASVVGLAAGGVLGTVAGPRTLVVGAGLAGLLVSVWLWRALWRRTDLDAGTDGGPGPDRAVEPTAGAASAGPGPLVQRDEVVGGEAADRLGHEAEVEVVGAAEADARAAHVEAAPTG